MMMKDTIRIFFNRNGMHIICCLGVIVSINLLSLFCFGLEIRSTEPVFSLTSTNEPLKRVLDKISEATGYRIEVTKSWENKIITTNIQDLTLDNSLRKVIRALGRPSNIIERYDKTKRIKIKIFDDTKGNPAAITKSYAQLQAKQAEAVINLNGSPEEQNEEMSEDTGSKIDSLDIEVIPPGSPDEKGITARELKEAQDKQDEGEPLDLEVFPPDNLGEK